MNRKHYPFYALAAAAVAAGAIWAGVPASSVLLLALVLACPLMMLTMHGGHGGGTGHAGSGPGSRGGHAGHHHDPAAEADQSRPSDPIVRH